MAAKWFWQSDSGWIEFNPAVTAAVEDGFQKKQKRVKVDNERFVDLVDMLQRRYDDESKRRAVKREVDVNAVAAAPPPAPAAPQGKTIFKNEIFYIMAKSAKKREKLSDDVSKHGGLVAEHYFPHDSSKPKRVTHVVCSEADVSSFQADLTKMAQDADVFMVTPEFVIDSLTEEDVQDPAQYTLSVRKQAKAAAPPAAPAAAAVAVAAAPPSASPSLQEFSGTKLVPYEFELVVQTVKDNTFTGYVYWPTLGKTKTKVKGSWKGAEVTFEEFDYMEGDGVELNNKYTGLVRPTGVDGTFVDNLKEQGRFTLTIAK